MPESAEGINLMTPGNNAAVAVAANPRTPKAETVASAVRMPPPGAEHCEGQEQWKCTGLSIEPLLCCWRLKVNEKPCLTKPQHQSAKAGRAKYHAWVAQTTEMPFSQFWRLGRPRSRCRPFWFLARALFSACS